MAFTLEFRVHRSRPLELGPLQMNSRSWGTRLASSKWGLLRGDQHQPVCPPPVLPLPSHLSFSREGTALVMSLVLSQTIASTVSKFKEESTQPFLGHFVIGRKIKYWLRVHKYGGFGIRMIR